MLLYVILAENVWGGSSTQMMCLSYVFVCDMVLYVLLAENVKGGSLAQVMCH